MSGTKILRGQLLIVSAITLAAIWGATQWTAAALGYQPELGPPWFMVGNWRLYPPPACFWWWFSFDAYAPQVFLRGAAIAASGGLAGCKVSARSIYTPLQTASQIHTFWESGYSSGLLVSNAHGFLTRGRGYHGH